MYPVRKPLNRICLYLAFTLGLPAASYAMSFGAGPLGGYNMANAAVEDHDDTEARSGLAAGLRTEFGVTSPFSLLVEALYVQSGARFDVSAGPFGDIRAEGNLDYLQIPVLAKAKFGSTAAHGFAYAGPAMGINLGAEGEFGGLSDTFKDEAANLVFSADIGAGAGFKVSEFVWLTGEARYSHGFTDALEEDVGDIDEWKARDIRLLAGVLIHLTR